MYDCPKIACDAIIFNEKNELLLIRRGKEPFLNMFAFPGGHMNIGETTEECCARELFEETGIKISPSELQLIGVYSDPKRDPRKHCVGVSYIGHVKNQLPKAADDAKTAEFIDDYINAPMAFDHSLILKDALKIKNENSK